jgi:hypothetical protein
MGMFLGSKKLLKIFKVGADKVFMEVCINCTECGGWKRHSIPYDDNFFRNGFGIRINDKCEKCGKQIILKGLRISIIKNIFKNDEIILDMDF